MSSPPTLNPQGHRRASLDLVLSDKLMYNLRGVCVCTVFWYHGTGAQYSLACHPQLLRCHYILCNLEIGNGHRWALLVCWQTTHVFCMWTFHSLHSQTECADSDTYLIVLWQSSASLRGVWTLCSLHKWHTLIYSPFTLVLDTADKSDPKMNQIPQRLFSAQRGIPVTSPFVHYIDTIQCLNYMYL